MKENKMLEKSEQFFPPAKYDFSHFSDKNCIAFTGSLLKHPYDSEKFILISDPLSDHTHFYEFNKKDVVAVKELSSISTNDGENVHLSKIWIKAGVIALKYEPFIVGKTTDIINEYQK